MKLHHYIEITGLVFLVLALLLEVVVGINNSLIEDARFEHLAKRLDEIHERQHLLQDGMNALAAQLDEERVVGVAWVREEKYGTGYDSYRQLDKENSKYDSVRKWFFFIGTILLLLGKLVEYNTHRQ